jgi:hypothetical protein
MIETKVLVDSKLRIDKEIVTGYGFEIWQM